MTIAVEEIEGDHVVLLGITGLFNLLMALARIPQAA
jgi:hypothetical protein